MKQGEKEQTTTANTTPSSIVVPPPTNAPPAASAGPENKPTQAVNSSNVPDSCCSPLISFGLLALGLIMFLIFVTIAGVLGQDQTVFCQGYWRNSTYNPNYLKYQFSGHSKVAVWALLQGSTFVFLGFLCTLEYLAASRKMVALRDQLRTLVLLTALFFIAWMIAGNVWIIGDETSGFGVVPQACKDGNMGNRNLYHFCLAILIFLDITVPLTLLAILGLSYNSKDKTFFNKTLGSANSDLETANSQANPANEACCTLTVSGATFVLGLIMFLIFVTIAGVLGSSTNTGSINYTTFCNGYWTTNPKYQLSGYSTVAVWANLMGATFFFLGLLWFLENRAAAMRAYALRDRLRTLLLLTTLFFLSWLIAGNVWIIGDENNMGVVPTDCKNGNMGNRNLYHFCLVIIIIMDIVVPIALCAALALTVDPSAGICLNRTLCVGTTPGHKEAPLALHERQAKACCSLPVACLSLFVFVLLFIVFIVNPSILEPGVMARSWDQNFCNGYWKVDPTSKYQLSGHSTAAVWALLQGSTILFLGLLWVFENLAATMNLIALRDQLRTLILLTSCFGIAWMIAGNAWIIGDDTTGSRLGVVPQACKDGNMGNRNLYHFCLAMIIFLDITVPLGLLAVAAKSGLSTTLSFCPIVAPPQSPQTKGEAPIVDVEKAEKPEKPALPPIATTMYVGQA